MAPGKEDSGYSNEAYEHGDEVVKKREESGDTDLPSSYDSKKNKKKLKKNKKNGGKEDEAEKTPALPAVPFTQLFRFATQNDLITNVIGIVAAIASAAGFPIMLVLFGDVTNSFVGGGLDADTLEQIRCNASYANYTIDYNSTIFDPDALQKEFTKFGVGCAIIGMVTWALGFVFVWCLNLTAENQVFRIRNEFLHAILRQDVGWYDMKESNDFASRITEDLNKLQEGIGEKIGLLVFSLFSFVINIISAFVHGWELTLVMLAVQPLVILALGLIGKVQSSATEKELEAYGKAGGVAEEVFSAIRTVFAFGGQRKEVERFSYNLTFAKKAGLKRGLATAVGVGLFNVMMYSSFALAFWYGITLILDSCGSAHPYNPSSMLVVFFSVLSGGMQVGMSAPYFEAISVARGAAASIFDVIDRKPLIDSSSKEGKKPNQVQGVVSFKKVVFNYPSRADIPILRSISFDVPSGQTVALVGTSGCGKSTCIQLLQRFYDPLAGEVTIDGNDIKELNLTWMREQIGVVGQEPVLFINSIADNIRYGREGVTQEEVEKAARQANAHDFIMRLPKQYETEVGDRGTKLSGGQKQRVAIARALIRNPKILLLDEATSALDVESERVVQKALDRARKGRTTIIVAHRLTTIRNADRIIVIREGVVEEDGSHSQLMAKNGVYTKMVLSQNGGNLDDTKDADRVSDDEDYSEDETVSRKSWMAQQLGLDGLVPVGLGRTGSIHSRKSAEIEDALPAEDEDAVDISILKILKLNAPEWPYILLGVLGAAVMGLSTPVYAILWGNIIGVLKPSYTDEGKAQTQSDGNYYSLLFLVVGVVTGAASFIQTMALTVAGEGLTNRLRIKAFEAIMNQEIAWFDHDENGVGALCTRLSADASSVQGATGSRISIVFQSVATLTFSVALSLYYDWRLGLVTTAIVPFVLLSTYLQGKILMKQNGLERKGLQLSAKVAMEAISNIRTVASLNREQTFHDRYMSSLTGPHVAAQRNAAIRGLVFGFASSAPLLAYGLVLYYGGWLVVNVGVDFQVVFKVSEALMMGTMSVGQAAAFMPNYNKAKLAASRIFDLLERKPLIDSSPTSGRQSTGVSGFVSMEDVQFRYPTRKGVNVLQGISLAAEPGKTIALVGHSGCGKSTCIQLMERFYDPEEGSVLVDNEDIRPFNVDSIRSHFAIVSQEPSLFNMTLAENIAYGDNRRTVPMEEIIEAAKKANIHTFIQALPLGYQTDVGQRGTQLSGGQKQRVAIARALVRNPKILLLDEATSALDTESEQVVQMALDKAREGRTCITIAHRLSTIRNADKILVLNHGKVAEDGTHDELLALKGLYYELCVIQGTVDPDSNDDTTTAL